jgi:hypothetical protein
MGRRPRHRILLDVATGLSFALAVWATVMTELERPGDAVGVEWGDARAGTRYSLRLLSGDINLQATRGVPPAAMRPGWESVSARTEWSFSGAAIEARRDAHRVQEWVPKSRSVKDHEPFGRVLYVSASLIYLALPGLLLTVLFLVSLPRRMRRPAPGACPACGYDCRATPGRCPECGRGADRV